MKITFKRREKERGLARVCSGHRGYEINLNGERIGSIDHDTEHKGSNWGWVPLSTDPWTVCVSRHGSIPHYNGSAETPKKLFLNLDDAKRWAKDYIRKHLEAK